MQITLADVFNFSARLVIKRDCVEIYTRKAGQHAMLGLVLTGGRVCAIDYDMADATAHTPAHVYAEYHTWYDICDFSRAVVTHGAHYRWSYNQAHVLIDANAHTGAPTHQLAAALFYDAESVYYSAYLLLAAASVCVPAHVRRQVVVLLLR